MTKIEDFRNFLADMDGLNSRLDALAKEASDASTVRAALLRRGKAVGLTIMAVDQMLANVRVDYRPPVDADADPDTQDGCAVATAEGAEACLDGVIVGGESGPHARPMHHDWVRSVRDQCQAAEVPFFFKQHGEWIGVQDLRRLPGGGGPGFGAYDHCPYDMDSEAVRVGKKTAGRELDGREWNEVPG